jgi:hypothetical protein
VDNYGVLDTNRYSPSTMWTRKNLGSRRGYAIVAAVWLAGLALAVTAEFSLHMRSNVLLSASRLRTSELDAISAGALQLTAWRVATETFPKINGEAQLCAWNADVTLAIRAQDHGGLLDANLAVPQLLEDVFMQLGVDQQRARKLSQEMIDYRDVDDQNQAGGPELLMRNGAKNKNAPFETAHELDLMPSMTDDLYWRVKPLFTTLSSQASLDPETMPKKLTDILKVIPNSERYFTRSSRRAFRISVTATHKNGTAHTISADMVTLRQPLQPFQIVTWQSNNEPEKIAAASTALPRCFN